MTRAQVLEQVTECLIDIGGVDSNIKPDDNYFELHGIDSLDMVEISIELEDTFDVPLYEDDLENLSTINELTDHIFLKIERGGRDAN